MVLAAWVLRHTAVGLAVRAVGAEPARGRQVRPVRRARALRRGPLHRPDVGAGRLLPVDRRHPHLHRRHDQRRRLPRARGGDLRQLEDRAHGDRGLLFGAATALQFQLPAMGVDVPIALLIMLPYLIALIAVGGLVGRQTGAAVPYPALRPMSALAGPADVRITAAGFTFHANFHPDAPRTVAAFRKLMPYRQRLILVRWSGEAAGSRSATSTGVGFETTPAIPPPATCCSTPAAQRAELLIAYGACSFASRSAARRQPLPDRGRRRRHCASSGRGAVGRRPGRELRDRRLTTTSDDDQTPCIRSAPRRRPAGSQARRIDMATARRRRGRSPSRPRRSRSRSTSSGVLMVIDMQNDFCTGGGWVDHLGVDYAPDRAPIAPLQRLLPRLARRGRRRWSGSTGATGPTSPNMPPNQLHLYKPAGPGHRPRRPAAGPRRARAREGQLGRRRRRRARDRARRHPRRQAPHQRLLGHAARLDPAQPRHAHHPLRRRQHRPVRAVHAAPTPTSSATAACCSRTAARPPRRRSAPRRRVWNVQASASASSPGHRRFSRGWRRSAEAACSVCSVILRTSALLCSMWLAAAAAPGRACAGSRRAGSWRARRRWRRCGRRA